MAPSFEEQRIAIQENTQSLIQKAQNSDRQAMHRARDIVKKKPSFNDLAKDIQDQQILEAEATLKAKRISEGTDADSKMTRYIDDEATTLEKIDEEEKQKTLELLGAGKGKKRAREDDDEREDNDDEGASIKKAFTKNMRPLIEKLERQIIGGGKKVVPGVSDGELAAFAARASNPEDVAAYLEKWSREDIDLDEGLKEAEDKDDDGSEDDGDMEGFIVGDEEIEDEDDDDDDDEDEDEDMGENELN